MHTTALESSHSRNIPVFLLFALLLAALALAGCNTVKGVGEDIKSAGDAGQRVLENN